MSDSSDLTPHIENKEGATQEYIKRLVLAHEKKKAFTREYMRQYRKENREKVNAYRRDLYKRKKDSENCTQV